MRQRIKLSPVLIIKSIGILGIAYVPVPAASKPSHEFISKIYARPTGEERWKASERRKQQILAEIRRIRKRIRLKAETLYLEEPKKKIVAYTARQKTEIHCIKLVNDIFTQKRIINELSDTTGVQTNSPRLCQTDTVGRLDLPKGTGLLQPGNGTRFLGKERQAVKR